MPSEASGPIRLARDGWSCEISPQIGGSILSLARDGLAVLRPASAAAIAADDPLGAAAYPLIPYANRIANGRFRFAGREHRLAANFPGPHTLHGVAWRRPWRVASAAPAACELALDHAPDADWPFAFEARQAFALGGDGLAVSLSLTNRHDRAAPAGLGLHAFFPRRPGERLAFRAAGAWTNGPDMLPSACARGGDWDFAGGRAVDAAALDNDFVGWDGRARLTAPGRPATLVEAGPAFRCLRVYAPAGEDFYAVEPVTHAADAINRADGPDAMAVLAPGEALAASARIFLERTP